MILNKVVLIFLGDFFYDARCQNMADTIIESGAQLHIIDAGKYGQKYKEIKIHRIELPQKGWSKFLIFYLRAKQILINLNPDIVIASDLFSLPISQFSINAYKVYDSRELYTHLGGLSNKPLKQFFWSQVEKFYINKVDSILVTAPGDAEILENKYKKLNIYVIYNYPKLSMKPVNTNNLRKKLNIDISTTIFLYQGVLHNGRGIIKMLEIMHHFKDANAIIIGDGPYKENLFNYIIANSLNDKVFFIDAVPYKKLLELTVEADIGFSLIEPLSISYEQALPNKLFEYALSGVAVIASNLPEMKRVVEKYNIGYCVPLNNLKSQVEAVKRVLEDNNGRSIQKMAEKKLNWEIQTSKFLKAININEFN